MLTRPTNTSPEDETRHGEDKEIILLMNSSVRRDTKCESRKKE